MLLSFLQGGVGQKNSLHGIHLRMQIQKVVDMYYLPRLHMHTTTGRIQNHLKFIHRSQTQFHIPASGSIRINESMNE